MWKNTESLALSKPETCRSCELWEVTHFQHGKEITHTGEGFCRPEGYPALGVAFCGEASGQQEEISGLPLRPYAAAGSIHTRVLRSLGVSRKQVLAFNVLSCRPPSNKLTGEWYEMHAIAKCAQHRNPIIQSFRDSVAANPAVREPVIVALGGTAFRTLTGLDGEKQSIFYARGYPVRTPYGLVVGTFHPAEVRRKLKHLGVLTEDYSKAFMYAREGFREFPRNYTLWPMESDIRDFRDRVRSLASQNLPNVWLNFDFETDDILPNMPRGTWPGLQSIQFSLESGKGIYIDINTNTWPVVAEILASNLRKAGFNCADFDVPLAHYWKLPINGIIDDELWMMHHFQPDIVMEDAGAEAETDFRFSTSASLQSVASHFGMDFIWKHLRTSRDPNEQRFYGCLTEESRVMLWDGGSKQIGNIVKQKQDVTLVGMDEFGNKIPVKVTNWHRSKIVNQNWLRIKTEAANQPLYLTPDHKVWTSEGWQRADKLNIGTLVKSHQPGADDFIQGGLLGDAAIDKRGRFKICHADDERDWFELKRKHLDGPYYPITRPNHKQNAHASEVWLAPSRWRVYRRDGKWFAPPISDRALAVWYCDNGCLAGGAPRIEDHKFINFSEAVGWFGREFGKENVSVYQSQGDDGKLYSRCIALKGDAKVKFFARVAKYVPECMSYKLPLEFRGKYGGWLDGIGPAAWTVVASIEGYKPRAGHMDRYCVDVDHPTHRFFAMGGLVHNCADVDAGSRIMAPVTGLPARMIEKGVWAGYERYVREFYPILKRMAERGLPIDRKSQFEFAGELGKIEIQLDKKIQAVHPDLLKMTAPKDGYVNGPKESEKIRKVDLPVNGNFLGTFEGWEWLDTGEDMNYPGREHDTLDEAEGDHLVTGVWRPMVQRTFVVTPRERVRCECSKFIANVGKKGQTLASGKWVSDVTCGHCYGKGRVTIDLPNREEVRWVRLLPFRTSQKQLLIYMHAKGHKPPKTKGHINTAAKGIQDLAKKTKDPLYQSILDIRTISKISSTYVTGRGWMDYGADDKPLPIEQQPDRVHTTPTLGPATGQTSTRRPNIQNCFSGDTEILTTNGWVRFDCLYAPDVDVAQFNSQTGMISFTRATRQIKDEYNGPMLEIQTEEQLDMLVTPEHECLVQNRHSKKFYKVQATNYPADALQLQAAEYEGGTVSWSTSKTILVAALQADGHVTETGAYDFTFRKARKCRRLEEALIREGVKYIEYPRRNMPGYRRFYVAAKDIPNWWKSKKIFGPWLLELDRKSFGAIASEIFLWDGCSTTKANYASKIKQNTDWAQILMALTGRRAHMRLYTSQGGSKSWQIDVSLRPSTSTSNHTKTEKWLFKGVVHCVTVPDGNIIVRRNNRVMITGNCPKHTRNENLKHLDLASRFRKLIKARPGHRIWEFDLKSAHALTLGLEAKCEPYMRLARMDVHTYMASHLAFKRKLVDKPIDLNVSDADLKAALKEMRSRRFNCTCAAEYVTKGKVQPMCKGIHLEADIRDVQAKPAILGYGFGMRGPKLRETNKESFDSDQEAQDVLDLIDAAFPALAAYRAATLAEAHDKHYLVARGGFMRWFWHVYDFVYDQFDQDKWRAEHGDDAEDALAFRPANTAFVYMRDIELRLEEMGINEEFNFVNVVHDSNVFEGLHDRPVVYVDPLDQFLHFGQKAIMSIPRSDDELAFIVKTEMERAQPLLGDPDVAPGGLSIGCDIKVGDNWGDMKEVKL